MSILIFLIVFLINTAELILNVQPASPGAGLICVAVYDSDEHFMKEEKSVFSKCFPVQGNGAQQIRIPGLLPGSYSIALIQDVNSDGALNKNLLGVPKEPYGFSNNVAGKWGLPHFDETKFELTKTTMELDIQLKYWKDF